MNNLIFSSVNKALQYLADFKQAKIIIATEDWYRLPENDELSPQIEALYELEYKYSQLKNNADKWEGNPQRYDNVLKKMGDLILDISQSVAESLTEVFEDWLKKHALLKASDWAEARTDDLRDNVSGKEMLQSVKFEYDRYNKGNWNKELNDMGLNI
jgi:cation transport regulator ChaB